MKITNEQKQLKLFSFEYLHPNGKTTYHTSIGLSEVDLMNKLLTLGILGLDVSGEIKIRTSTPLDQVLDDPRLEITLRDTDTPSIPNMPGKTGDRKENYKPEVALQTFVYSIQLLKDRFIPSPTDKKAVQRILNKILNQKQMKPKKKGRKGC